MSKYLIPEWPAPSNVKAFTSTRLGGFSEGPYASFNLGKTEADDPIWVNENQIILKQELNLPSEPVWLKQVHGNLPVAAESITSLIEADASYTHKTNIVCAVLTADCLPVLICDTSGTCVAAVHAGWRGLLAGVIERTVQALQQPGKNLMAWLGPAIGPEMFELGDDVRELFLQEDTQAERAFKTTSPGKYLANIYTLAKLRLNRVNVNRIYGGQFCTFTDSQRFYSYRRDKGQTGRMTSLIWLEQ